MKTETDQSPFVAGTGMMCSTESGQRVTAENAHHLPPGSVVRLDDTDVSDGVLVHLHDGLWYWYNGHAWCYDTLERQKRRLPGTLCHLPY